MADAADSTAGAMSPRVAAAIAQLRGGGERVTRARQAILQVLDRTDEHLVADEIVARAERSVPGVHRATVYRALSTLGELGLITHTHVGGAAAVYHLALPPAADATGPIAGVTGSHAHLQCTNCQKLIDIPVTLLAELTARLDADYGFALEPRHAALLGLCADCRNQSPSAG